mmetsp:Transcript_10696/g.16068  ORF Transcript_10696/g.16068 Transcript_10696/m.16068 type:complete len:214 (-) Transcript_10696:6-647(-)
MSIAIAIRLPPCSHSSPIPALSPFLQRITTTIFRILLAPPRTLLPLRRHHLDIQIQIQINSGTTTITTTALLLPRSPQVRILLIMEDIKGKKEKASRCASILRGGSAAMVTRVTFRTIWEMVMITTATRITMAADIAGVYRFLAIMVVKATTILLEGEVVGSVCMCGEIFKFGRASRRAAAYDSSLARKRSNEFCTSKTVDYAYIMDVAINLF